MIPHIIKTEVSIEGITVAFSDGGMDGKRFELVSGFHCGNNPEKFVAEGDAYVHFYTFEDDVPANIVKTLMIRNALNAETLSDAYSRELLK